MSENTAKPIEETNRNKFHSSLSSTCAIVDLITVMSTCGCSFDELETRTL